MKIKHLLASLLLPMAFGALAEPFTVSGDGQEVTDVKSGLVWRRCAEGMTASGGTCTGTASRFTLGEALTRASAQTTATAMAWRLPNIKELSSIADRDRFIAIDTTTFTGTPAGSFWSSTPDARSADYAWNVNFSNGDVYYSNRSNSHYVRLVRAGK